MRHDFRLRTALGAVLAALMLAACGGGGDAGSAVTTTQVSFVPSGPGSPAATGDIATDGRNWINYRRAQAGMPALTQNAVVDVAALGHANYLRLNNLVSHTQTSGNPGFTGASLLDRLNAAGYTFSRSAAYAYGEVISGTSSNSGFYMAEELITAIYHRFVIFEPKFKEIGTGAATNSSGYAYFTADFTANNGYGPGLGNGGLVTWPYDGQTAVPANFLSDYEAPDPVPGRNEVGYPISVHANINAVLTVGSFTVQPHGGAALQVQRLTAATDADTPRSAAAIIPLAALAARTTYDVSFSGTVDGVAVTRAWSFVTK
ncbi:MAG TPA: CAP domain-containing protein [Telluria sp.]|nr:CAP domain-containing protein [Telluria sp.]